MDCKIDRLIRQSYCYDPYDDPIDRPRFVYFILCSMFRLHFSDIHKKLFHKKEKNNFSRILQISLKMSFVYRKGYQINRWLLTDWFLKGFLIHWAKNHSFQFTVFINVLWTILISNFYSMKNIYIVVKPSIDRNPIVVLS